MSSRSADRVAAGLFAALAAVAIANLPVTLILARSLTPEGYGSFQFLNRLALIAISVAQAGMPHALSWGMTRARNSTDDQVLIYRTGCKAALGGGLIVAFLGLALFAAGIRLASFEEWVLISFYPLTNLFAASVANAARGLLDIRSVAAVRISQALAWLGSVIALLLFNEITILNTLGVLVASQLLGALVACGVVVRAGVLHRVPVKHAYQTQIWKFARRVFLGHTLRDWNVYLDQVVLGFLLPPAELGFYALAAGMSLALNLLSTPISATVQPVVQREALSQRGRMVAQLLATTIVAVGSAAAGLAVAAPFLIGFLVGPAYAPSILLVQILCGAVLLDGINTCLHGALLGLNAPGASSRNAAIGLGFNVVGWVVLLPLLGVLGAALTSVVSYGVVSITMARSVASVIPGCTVTGLIVATAREMPGFRFDFFALSARVFAEHPDLGLSGDKAPTGFHLGATMKILFAMRSLQQSEGGPITAASGLAEALVARSHEVTIVAHDDGMGADAAEGFAAPAGVDVKFFSLTRRAWEHSREYARWLDRNVSQYDLVVINSVWISHVYFAARACQKYGVSYIVRPHGCLTSSDMSHHRLRKSLYLSFIEKKNLRLAVAVHCTAEPEANDATMLGLKNTVTIPLGVDSSLLELDRGQAVRNRVVFIGRIAEKKGVDILIRALASRSVAELGMTLDVLGVDHRGLQAQLQGLARSLGVSDRVTFHGHVGRSQRAEFLREAGVLALPSKDENFGLAVAEAMASAVPVIVTPNVSHASLIEKYEAGLVVARNVDSFSAALTQIARLDAGAYESMSISARTLVRNEYSWDRTAERLEMLMPGSGMNRLVGG